VLEAVLAAWGREKPEVPVKLLPQRARKSALRQKFMVVVYNEYTTREE